MSYDIEKLVDTGAFYAGELTKEEFERLFNVELDYDEYKGKDTVSVFCIPYDDEDPRLGYPRLGSSLTRQEIVSHGGEQAGFFFDRLNEGEIWRWINANAILQKRGNLMVVIEEI